jgi:hypothetical protein
MAINAAFAPTSAIFSIAGTTSASTAVQLQTPAPGSSPQLCITNTGTVAIMVGWGPSAAVAQANANAVPATGSNSGDPRTFVVAPSLQVTITYQPGSFVSVVCASTTATVYLQAGDGL